MFSGIPLTSGSGAGTSRQQAVSLYAEATVLNDLTPTSTPATNSVDPYTGATSSGVRRRRPFLVAGRSVSSDLIEGSRINICTQSQTFNTTWTTTEASVTANAVNAPDGTATADALVETSVNNQHRVLNSIAYTAAIYTGSVYAKAGTRSWMRIQMFDGTGYSAYFNLSTGVVGTVAANTTASITSVGNGWYRCSVTTTVNMTVAGGQNINIGAANADNSNSYAGTDAAVALYLWGAQVEAGSFPSSYIPTVAASVTRGADTLLVSLASLAGGTLSTSAGTVMGLAMPYGWSLTTSGGASGYTLYSTSPAGSFSFAVLRINVGGANFDALRRDSLPANNQITGSAPVSGLNVALHTWGASNHRLYSHGVLRATDSSVTLPYTTVNDITIGSQTTGAAFCHSWIALLYWPRQLTTEEVAIISRESGLAGVGLL